LPPETRSRRIESPVRATQSIPKQPRLADCVKAFEGALKLFHRGNFGDARDAFERLIDKYPNQTEILARVAQYLEVCRTRLRTPPRVPHTPDAYYDRGVMELNRANYESAISLFEKALKGTKQPHILYSLAAAQTRVGRTEEGLRNLEQAVALRDVHRSQARQDPDFLALRQDPRFQELVGILAESDV
jgi:tetratricopeptide (TPR) repeat protein